VIPHDTLVALSVSAAAPADLHARGLSQLHLRFLFTELVRHILAAGGCIAYGGKLDDPVSSEPNFTRIMLDMVGGYRPDLRPDDSRLVNFVAATVWNAEDPAKKAEYQQTVAHYEGRFQVEQCPMAPLQPVDVASPRARAALALTSVRERMTGECAARVVIGGTLAPYLGRYPGVVEEAVLMAGAHKPLFVVGGFGGAGAALAAHLQGQAIPELTQQWHVDHANGVAELAGALTGTAYALQLDTDLATALPPGGWEALHNGLSNDDNARLATTTDVDEVVALVLRGLHSIAPTVNGDAT